MKITISLVFLYNLLFGDGSWVKIIELHGHHALLFFRTMHFEHPSVLFARKYASSCE